MHLSSSFSCSPFICEVSGDCAKTVGLKACNKMNYCQDIVTLKTRWKPLVLKGETNFFSTCDFTTTFHIKRYAVDVLGQFAS